MNTLEKLQAIIDACTHAVHLEVRPNMVNHESVADYFDRLECPPDDHERRQCIESDIIYDLCAYDRNNVGSYQCFGPTLESVVDQMCECLGIDTR